MIGGEDNAWTPASIFNLFETPFTHDAPTPELHFDDILPFADAKVYNFGTFSTPSIAELIARFGLGLVIDSIDIDACIRILKVSIKNYKTKITKYINNNYRIKSKIDDDFRRAAYANFDAKFEIYCLNLRAHAQEHRAEFQDRTNLSSRTRAAINVFLHSPYQLIVADKGYGLEVMRKSEVKLTHRETALLSRTAFGVPDPTHRTSEHARCRRAHQRGVSQVST